MGAGLVFWRDRDRLAYLERELGMANDRLYAAWQDGAVVPPRPAEPTPPPKPFSAPLEDWLAQWESAETREMYRAHALSYRASGSSDDGILKRFQGHLNGGDE